MTDRADSGKATEALSKAYIYWLDGNGIQHASADELLMAASDVALTTEQQQWLTAFVTVWDGVQEMEDDAREQAALVAEEEAMGKPPSPYRADDYR